MRDRESETWNAGVAKILEHFQLSPLGRQAAAAFRESEDFRRAEAARERAQLIAERGKREAELLRVRDRAAERVAKADAELTAALAGYGESEAALSELNRFDVRIQELEHDLRVTASPSIGETAARLRELLESLRSLFRCETFDARGTVGDTLTWSNRLEIEAAQGEIRGLLAELREIELETLGEPALQMRLAEVVTSAAASASRIPRAPEAGWGDRRAGELSRELAAARAKRFKEDAAEKIRVSKLIEQNRQR